MGRTRTRLMLRLKVHWSVRRSAGRGMMVKAGGESLCSHIVVYLWSHNCHTFLYVTSPGPQ